MNVGEDVSGVEASKDVFRAFSSARISLHCSYIGWISLFILVRSCPVRIACLPRFIRVGAFVRQSIICPSGRFAS